MAQDVERSPSSDKLAAFYQSVYRFLETIFKESEELTEKS
jgi:hypothetical protein